LYDQRRNDRKLSIHEQEELERREEARRRQEQLAQARRDKLRREQTAKPPKLSNPKVVNELENEPAYLRRRIEFDDLPNPEEQELSRWSITEDEAAPLKRDNSFLHDNVDWEAWLRYLRSERRFAVARFRGVSQDSL